MTVRANKPAFNVREKLKSLDYSHLPYEKMPAGSVISTTTGLFAELSCGASTTTTIISNFKFYPKLANSRILMDLNLRNVTGGTDNFTTLEVYWGTSSTYSENTRLDSNANSGTNDPGKNGFLYLTKRGTGSHDITNQSFLLRDVPVFGTMDHFLTVRANNSSSSSTVIGRHSAGFSISIQEIKQ